MDANGKVTGYGELAMQACPDATLLGHANYVGPKWETGDAAQKTFNDRGVQESLLGYVTDMEKIQLGMEKARIALGKAGHDYDFCAYEGGPSGYTFGATRSEAETQEKYGKSLAMAVGCPGRLAGKLREGLDVSRTSWDMARATGGQATRCCSTASAPVRAGWP